MQIVRFSAVEIFGVPVDRAEDLKDVTKMAKLMGSYGVQASIITPGLVDITPYYWTHNAFRYYLSQEEENGPATVDLMPRYHDSSTFMLDALNRDTLIGIETPKRTIKIPTEQSGMGILGPGPRYSGQVCVHEIITAR